MQGRPKDPSVPRLLDFELGKGWWGVGRTQLDPKSSNTVMEVYRVKFIGRKVFNWILDYTSYIPLHKAEKTKMHLGYTTCLVMTRDLILL